MKRINILFTVIAFMLVALVTSIINASFESAPVLFAVAAIGGMYTPAMQQYRDKLFKKVSKEVWLKGKLGQLSAFIDYDKFKKTGQFGVVKGSKPGAEAVVHTVQDFKAQGKGGIRIDIPLLRPLTGRGVFGTDTLKGKGEKRKIFNSQCMVNMRRHAVVTRDNEMSEQVLPNQEMLMALTESGVDDLKDWFSRLTSYELTLALFYGFSENLFEPSFGLGSSYVAKKSHPHFYVQGDGKISWSTANTFDAGYEALIATGLATLSDATEDHFGIQSIRNMVYEARKEKIQPLKYQGQEAYLILIHDAQARQLRADSEYKQEMREAWRDTKSNPLFTGAVEGYLIEGAFVVVDSTLPAAYINGDTEFVAALSTTGTTAGIQYGSSSNSLLDYMENPRDAGSRKGAVLLGQGAIHAAEAKGFKKTEEIDDHEQWVEHGGRMIYGATRADIIDTDNYMGNGADLFYGNHSSLVYFTFSPDTITI